MASVVVPTEDVAVHALPVLPEMGDSQVVCRCLDVTAGDIRSANEMGEVESLQAVMAETRAGTGCTCCHPVIRRLLDG